MDNKTRYIILLKHFLNETNNLAPLSDESKDSIPLEDQEGFALTHAEIEEELPLADIHREYKTNVYVLADMLDGDKINDETVPLEHREKIERGIKAFGERALYNFDYHRNLKKVVDPDNHDDTKDSKTLFADYEEIMRNKINSGEYDDLIKQLIPTPPQS